MLTPDGRVILDAPRGIEAGAGQQEYAMEYGQLKAALYDAAVGLIGENHLHKASLPFLSGYGYGHVREGSCAELDCWD